MSNITNVVISNSVGDNFEITVLSPSRDFLSPSQTLFPTRCGSSADPIANFLAESEVAVNYFPLSMAGHGRLFDSFCSFRQITSLTKFPTFLRDRFVPNSDLSR